MVSDIVSNKPSKSTGLGDNRKGSDILIIYKVTNIVNKKIYIGQTVNSLEYRKNQHIREARCSKRKGVYFHNAINKYGAENFIFEEIDNANKIEELNEKERHWISFYNSNNKSFGYNLDSGGQNGGYKSEETKKKIGMSTIKKWKNPDIASKMLEGLRRGNETTKNSPRKTSTINCAYCGAQITIPFYEAKNRKYCSNQCVANDKKWESGVKAAAHKMHEDNVQRKLIIKQDIIEWVTNNKDLVLNCPKNKIRSTLSELIEIIDQKYDISDFRSLYDCFDDVTNMKTFLTKLQKIIPEENVC